MYIYIYIYIYIYKYDLYKIVYNTDYTMESHELLEEFR